MGQSTISMAIFNSKLFVHQRVSYTNQHWPSKGLVMPRFRLVLCIGLRDESLDLSKAIEIGTESLTLWRCNNSPRVIFQMEIFFYRVPGCPMAPIILRFNMIYCIYIYIYYIVKLCWIDHGYGSSILYIKLNWSWIYWIWFEYNHVVINGIDTVDGPAKSCTTSRMVETL